MKAFEVTYENLNPGVCGKGNKRIVYAEDFAAASKAIRDTDKEAFATINSFVETTLKENIH